jgi:hypothetical protein
MTVHNEVSWGQQHANVKMAKEQIQTAEQIIPISYSVIQAAWGGGGGGSEKGGGKKQREKTPAVTTTLLQPNSCVAYSTDHNWFHLCNITELCDVSIYKLPIL